MKVIQNKNFTPISIEIETIYDLREMVKIMGGYGCFNTHSGNVYTDLCFILRQRENGYTL